MKLYDLPKYGPQISTSEGWIASVGEHEFAHTFGGNSWDIADVNNKFSKPTLLMTLDLKDPRISLPKIGALESLSICSHINCDAWTARQTFIKSSLPVSV
jgi:hypothetical protein